MLLGWNHKFLAKIHKVVSETNSFMFLLDYLEERNRWSSCFFWIIWKREIDEPLKGLERFMLVMKDLLHKCLCSLGVQ